MFYSRIDAGRQLAKRLMEYANREDVLVLGIPRGGVPVAFEVAQALDSPLDILLVRKLAAPWHREFAIGAVASGGVRVLNHDVIASLNIPGEVLTSVLAEQEAELRKREQMYRGVRPGVAIDGKITILVDDGVATGSSIMAAIDALRMMKSKKIVVASPVCSPDAQYRLRKIADEVVCLVSPEWFHAIGQFYEDFSQTGDDEVRSLLEQSARSLDARVLETNSKHNVA